MKMIKFYLTDLNKSPPTTAITPIAAPALYLSGYITVIINRGRRYISYVIWLTSVALIPLYNGYGCVLSFVNAA